MEIDAKNPMPSRRKKSELLHKLQGLSAGSGLQLACNKSARTSKSKSPGQVERTLYPPGFGARHRRRRRSAANVARIVTLSIERCRSSSGQKWAIFDYCNCGEWEFDNSAATGRLPCNCVCLFVWVKGGN